MNAPMFESIAARAAATGMIEPSDVQAIRRAVYSGDGQISLAVAEAMFAVDRGRRAHNPAWSELFVEVLADFSLNQQPPSGYLSEENAGWIEAQVMRRKEPATDTDVALLARIIETAREVPPSFSAFALRVVKEAVLYGDTPDERGRPMDAGRVDEAEIDLLRRVLWGAGAEGHLAVSREEAEMLFAIADATAGAENTPLFEDLFARAVGNYLVGATGRNVPSRADALRWQADADYKVSVVGMLAGVLSSSLQASSYSAVLDTVLHARSLGADLDQAQDDQNRQRAAAQAVAEVLSPEKTGWLIDRIDRNGLMTPAEKALLRFVQREAKALGIGLGGVMSKVA